MDISRMTVPELFEHVSELPAAKRSIALKQIANLRTEIKTLLKLAYHKNIQLDLPEGDPPYKPMELPENWGMNRIPAEIRKFQYFMPGNNLNALKREKLFIEILESVSPEEAKFLLMVKNKKLTYKGFNRKLVEDALPEIFQGE